MPLPGLRQLAAQTLYRASVRGHQPGGASQGLLWKQSSGLCLPSWQIGHKVQSAAGMCTLAIVRLRLNGVKGLAEEVVGACESGLEYVEFIAA